MRHSLKVPRRTMLGDSAQCRRKYLPAWDVPEKGWLQPHSPTENNRHSPIRKQKIIAQRYSNGHNRSYPECSVHTTRNTPPCHDEDERSLWESRCFRKSRARKPYHPCW